MALLHASVSASRPEHTASFLADVMGGTALPFPPCPGGWIAFSQTDDGQAVEVCPATTRVAQGDAQITFANGHPDSTNSATHLAVASPLSADQICTLAARADWPARLCNRGPFSCLEIWIDDRLSIEVLDSAMQAAYRSGMTVENWAAMFDLPPKGEPS